jgi:hypothetical protein
MDSTIQMIIETAGVICVFWIFLLLYALAGKTIEVVAKANRKFIRKKV